MDLSLILNIYWLKILIKYAKHKHIHKKNTITNIWNYIIKHKIVINYKNILINNFDFQILTLKSGGYKKEYIVIHDVMFIYQNKWALIKFKIDKLWKQSIHLKCNYSIGYYACLK